MHCGCLRCTSGLIVIFESFESCFSLSSSPEPDIACTRLKLEEMLHTDTAITLLAEAHLVVVLRQANLEADELSGARRAGSRQKGQEKHVEEDELRHQESVDTTR